MMKPVAAMGGYLGLLTGISFGGFKVMGELIPKDKSKFHNDKKHKHNSPAHKAESRRHLRR